MVVSEVHNSIENIDEQIRKLENKSIDDYIEKNKMQTTKVFKMDDDITCSFSENTPIIVSSADDTLFGQSQVHKNKISTRQFGKRKKLTLVLVLLLVVGLLFLFF